MTHTGQRGAQIARFYAAHQPRLQRIVAAQVRAANPRAIDGACQTAWTILLRRPDVTLDDLGDARDNDTDGFGSQPSRTSRRGGHR